MGSWEPFFSFFFSFRDDVINNLTCGSIMHFPTVLRAYFFWVKSTACIDCH